MKKKQQKITSDKHTACSYGPLSRNEISVYVARCVSAYRSCRAHPPSGTQTLDGYAESRAKDAVRMTREKANTSPPKKLCAAPAPRSDRASASRKRWFARPKTRTLSHLKASVATPLSPASHQPTNDVMVFTTYHSECDATMRRWTPAQDSHRLVYIKTEAMWPVPLIITAMMCRYICYKIGRYWDWRKEAK